MSKLNYEDLRDFLEREFEEDKEEILRLNEQRKDEKSFLGETYSIVKLLNEEKYNIEILRALPPPINRGLQIISKNILKTAI